MITNATWQTLESKTGAGPDGVPTFAAAVTVNAALLLNSVSSKQRYELGATIKDADLVAYVEKDAGAEAALGLGDRMTLLYDQGTVPVVGIVVAVGRQEKEVLTHLEVFLKPDGGN